MKQHKIAVTCRVDGQAHVSTIYASVGERPAYAGRPGKVMLNAEYQALRRRVDNAVQEFVNDWMEGDTFLD